MIHQLISITPGWRVSFMAEMRRNIAHRRHVVGECVYWPRTVLISFFVFCVVTYGAVIGWQIIIESENIYLETGAALVTVLFIASVSIYVLRRYRAYRQGLNELRQAHPHSPGEDEDLSSFHLRLYLRHIYGNSADVDGLLASGGSGLPTEIIDSLVRNYTYSSKEKSSLVHVHDVELGITRADTVSTVLSHTIIHCHDNVYADGAGGSCGSGMGVENGTCVVDSSPKYFTYPVECSVCLMEYNEGDILSELPCRHTYHRDCVTGWLLLQNACPMCKQAVFVLPPLSMLYPTESANANSDANVPTEEIRATDLPQSVSSTALPTETHASLSAEFTSSLPTSTAQRPLFEQLPLRVLDAEDA